MTEAAQQLLFFYDISASHTSRRQTHVPLQIQYNTTSHNRIFRPCRNTMQQTKTNLMPVRALLLGHTVQVNESHYSVSDKRRLDKIKETLRKREVI